MPATSVLKIRPPSFALPIDALAMLTLRVSSQLVSGTDRLGLTVFEVLSVVPNEAVVLDEIGSANLKLIRSFET